MLLIFGTKCAFQVKHQCCICLLDVCSSESHLALNVAFKLNTKCCICLLDVCCIASNLCPFG